MAAMGWLLGLWLAPEGLAPWVALISWSAAAVLAERRGRRLIAAACLIGASLVAGGLAGGARPGDATLPDGVRDFEGVVVRPATHEEVAGLRRLVVDVDGLRVRVAERDPQGPPPLPGDRVRFAAELRGSLGWRNPGASDGRDWLRAQGLDALATARPPGVEVLVQGEGGLWRMAARARARLARPLTFPGDGSALLRALALGERGALAPSLEDAFRRTGTAHVLSVSGLHLAAIAGLIYLAARRLARALLARFPSWTRWISDADRVAACTAAPLAAAYTLVTGAEVATVRALVCVVFVLAGRLLARRADPLTTLAAAALALTAWQPAAAHDASFQLSFAAAATLTLAASRLAGRALPVRLFGMSAAVWLVTAPIGAAHFGQLQLLGLLANPLVVPVLELVFLPAALVAALLGLVWPAGGAALGWLAAHGAGGVAWAVRALASVAPVLDAPSPRPVEWLLLAGSAAAFWWRRPRAAALALGAAALHLVWTVHGAPLLRDEVTVTFLDVGQGDAALVEVPGPERWLVDTGGILFGAPLPDASADARLLALRRDPGERAIWPFLRARRIGRLDVVVLSHPHPDHFGGLRALLDHVGVGEVWTSGEESEDPRWLALLAELDRRAIPVVRPRTRLSGGAALVALPPVTADPGASVNDNSLVVRVDYAGRRVLFTGDLEAPGELARLGSDLAADVVKVPHHGSKTSSTAAFVAATGARIAVVSCGRNNLFDFPAPEVVARWQAAGAEVRRIDEEGAIVITLSGE